MNADNLSAWAETMCQRHYTYLREITNHVPYSASLFTFRCPYMVGGFASLLESDGTTISQVPIMSVDWTDEAVTVESFENNATDYEYTQQRTADDTASTQAAQINELATYEPLHVSISSFSSFPKTVYNSAITSDMRVIDCVWGTPSSITDDVTWTTYNGSITLSGTISGSTTAELTLVKTN